jgi:hypothetical protein
LVVGHVALGLHRHGRTVDPATHRPAPQSASVQRIVSAY